MHQQMESSLSNSSNKMVPLLWKNLRLFERMWR